MDLPHPRKGWICECGLALQLTADSTSEYTSFTAHQLRVNARDISRGLELDWLSAFLGRSKGQYYKHVKGDPTCTIFGSL